MNRKEAEQLLFNMTNRSIESYMSSVRDSAERGDLDAVMKATVLWLTHAENLNRLERCGTLAKPPGLLPIAVACSGSVSESILLEADQTRESLMTILLVDQFLPEDSN